MASRGDSPTLFAGQPWSAYYEGVVSSRREEAKDASQPDGDEGTNEGGSMKLHKDDIRIFGVCPSLDEFYLTVCDYCGAVIKPQALMGHIEIRHKGTNNEFKPLEHLTTNKEPLLKPPHKNKAKLNAKAPPQNLMTKYGLPKAPPNCHPNGKPKSAIVEQLNRNLPPPLSKASNVVAAQLSSAPCKLMPPRPPPPPPLLPPPLPPLLELQESALPVTVFEQTPSPAQNNTPAAQLNEACSVRETPLLLNGASLPAQAVASLAIKLGTSAEKCGTSATAAQESTMITVPPLERQVSADEGCAVSDYAVKNLRESSYSAVTRKGSTPCLMDRIGISNIAKSDCSVGSGNGATVAGTHTSCVPADSSTGLAAHVANQAAASNCPTFSTLGATDTSLNSCCSNGEDGCKGSKRSPASTSPPPFKKPCRHGSVPGSNAASRLLPCKDREYDPDKHCGVFIDHVHKNCTRSLTCKTHALSLRRKVHGRNKPFDQLLKEHREAKETMQLSKRMGISPPSLHSSRISKTPPSASHSPRVAANNFDQAMSEAARAASSIECGSGYSAQLLHRQSSMPDGYLTHHPRPLAVNTFGVRLNGCAYVLNRKSDILRTAVQATLDQRQLQLLPSARKVPVGSKGGSGNSSSSNMAKDVNNVGTADGLLSSPAFSRLSSNLTGTIQAALAASSAPSKTNLMPAVPRIMSSGQPGYCSSGSSSATEGSTAKRHRSGDSSMLIGASMLNVQSGVTATHQLLSSSSSSGPTQRPLLASLAVKQQDSCSTAPAMAATLLALSGNGAANSLVRFGAPAMPSTMGFGSTTGKGPGSSMPGTATAVLVTDISLSGIDKSGSAPVMGSNPTAFLLTSLNGGENPRIKGGLVNGSIQMTTNTSSIGALTNRATAGAPAIAATLLSASPSGGDGPSPHSGALASTCVTNAVFRKPEFINSVAANTSVGGTPSLPCSAIAGMQLQAIAGQRHFSITTPAASQPAASIGMIVGSGSTLMAGQHLLQPQQSGTSSGFPLHISSSSIKSLPHHSIRLVNASQPHQTLRQQQQLSPAVSLTLPLVAASPAQPQPQQQQSAVHKATAAQSSMSNLRV